MTQRCGGDEPDGHQPKHERRPLPGRPASKADIARVLDTHRPQPGEWSPTTIKGMFADDDLIASQSGPVTPAMVEQLRRRAQDPGVGVAAGALAVRFE